MASWEAADGLTVEYSPAVVEEVRRLAVDGFMAFGHGGLEVGGVLYGAREGHRVSVLASAELPCEHAFGPGFVLSENDRQALTRSWHEAAGTLAGAAASIARSVPAQATGAQKTWVVARCPKKC